MGGAARAVRSTDRRGRSAVSANLPDASSAAPNTAPPAWLVIRGARQNNLRGVDAALPLGRFICVTGVSGSGKSSLINDILHNSLSRELHGAATPPGAFDRIELVDAAGRVRPLRAGSTRTPTASGSSDSQTELVDKVIAIDQTPIGRTPRSNPATYIKVFDEIRDLYTKLPDAKLRGYKAGRFSFNVPSGAKGGGRCEACEGNGSNRVEMDFLADVWVTCPVCEGQRFNRETRQIHFKGKSIAAVLELDVQQALEHFESQPRIRGMLQTLHDVGLDYLKLGQPSPTLSGGEAQRIKLARELVRKPTGRTVYILDEPTTGLHFADVRRLLEVLHGFVESGNTVVVIEHNLDVVKTADWVIDLGPEGGAGGGEIVAVGTPEDVAQTDTHTGHALREVLGGDKPAGRSNAEPATEPAALVDLDHISVRGARQHNLKDVALDLPRDQLTVFTGVSGSGKTSLAIDTIFTEGYRRYVESLSAYARQFLGQLQKPDVDHVAGLSPAICIEQKASSKSPRSTVGTVTEIYDYLRVLWARIGTRYCPRCDEPIGAQTLDQIVDRILDLEESTPVIVLAPIAPGDGDTYAAMFQRLKNSGYTRVRIDGQITETAHATTLDARRKHRIEVVIDRTIVRRKARARLSESVEHALALAGGRVVIAAEEVERHEPEDTPEGAGRTTVEPAREWIFSQKLACLRCGSSYEELAPNHFSFNNAFGWCETCEGLGVQRGAAAGAILARPQQPLLGGAIAGWGRIEPGSGVGRMLLAVCRRLGVDPSTPLLDWTPAQRNGLLFGTEDAWLEAPPARSRSADRGERIRFRWRGFFPTIDAATRHSWSLRYRLNNVLTDIACITCRGGRLRADAAATRLDGVGAAPGARGPTLVEMCQLPLADAYAFFESLKLSPEQRQIAGEVLIEIRSRLRFLIDVGLDYLTLHRAAPTLSGGEAQRIRLASQIGSGLTGVLYVLDEPTIGLHPRDTRRLVEALHRLRDLGNTLVVVEHDRDVIRSADRLVDFGPRAGAFGGEVVAQGAPREFLRRKPSRQSSGDPPSLTGEYLSGVTAVPIPANRRPVAEPTTPPAAHGSGADGKLSVRAARRGMARRFESKSADVDGPVASWLTIRGARQHNLKNVDATIPLGRFVCVTGVSGSGKSSLINDILWPALARRMHVSSVAVGEHDEIVGAEALSAVIDVDQSPLGATPLSNPATYTGVFEWIRELFARLPESKLRGYQANRFSFNRPGGRCDACEGYGQKKIEMHFMPDVWVECEACRGKRYNPETLEPKFRGRTIADVLEMRVSAALELFESVPRVKRMLQSLADVGLDYLQLGQSAATLSGGEAQRVKLAAELGKPDTGSTLYILDEPTTGLHFDDVGRLIEIFHRLVDLGNTVLVVEHNLDVIKSADWIIELGPDGGEAGGRLVFRGSPEQLVERGDTHTAAALAPLLASDPRVQRPRYDRKQHAERELEINRAGLGRVGRDVKMPWQTDGRRWHLEQRPTRSGGQAHWESAALEFVEKLVQTEGRSNPPGFAETNWNERASVEIAAEDASVWFLHALTGGEWLLELYFRVPGGTSNAAALARQLTLKTLDERPEIQAYGDWSRVDVRPRQDGFDAVVVYAHDRAELDTPGFRKFVAQAVRAYLRAATDA